jgi:hypothetical protein
MIAAHLESLLFLLLLALAGLFQLLGRAARKTREEEEPTAKPAPRTVKPIPRAPAQSDEERVRKFLEALGQPASSRPPPRVAQRPTYRKPFVLPQVPPRASPLPPLVTRPPDLPTEFQLPPQTAPRAAGRPEKPAPSAETVFEVHKGLLSVEQPRIIKTPMETYTAATRPIAKGAELKTDIATLLASKSRLRDAIILREIFGPPRALQALDLL